MGDLQLGHLGHRQQRLRGAEGACWTFIKMRMGQIIYGTYPEMERWRPDIVFFLGLGSLLAILPKTPLRRPLVLFLLFVWPVLAFVLLVGGTYYLPFIEMLGLADPVAIFSLPFVSTDSWGGLLVTLVVAVTGITASFPLGIILALARRSNMPVAKSVAVVFIETVRGVPLISILFMSSVMLPLFLPPGNNVDKLLRALVGVALFSAAYMAEVIRGGLQAIPKGQYEAGKALGLGYWKSTRLIILPQALKLVIPGIVNSFISLFKDTTLVSIIGLRDLFNVLDDGAKDASWLGRDVEAYVFAALMFGVFCFAMSRVSMRIERRLDTGHRK
ncbi:amino acid ABC transporter permease [Oleomonas cavernae]|uniref:amino acid ABC transporter permease n=1 Tax=Oleomonas cavernae TaxID=2320859 RepID=UPI001F35E0EF|nr:amino acid ABC transporter permease [Oleomonas cavernae]